VFDLLINTPFIFAPLMIASALGLTLMNSYYGGGSKRPMADGAWKLAHYLLYRQRRDEDRVVVSCFILFLKKFES
jgi:hypothetical protein